MMIWYQEKFNKNTGQILGRLREAKGLSQDAFIVQIDMYMNDKLKKAGYTDKEVQLYFEGKLKGDENGKYKGISIYYKPMARSTLSNYENGKWDIPVWFLTLALDILSPELYSVIATQLKIFFDTMK